MSLGVQNTESRPTDTVELGQNYHAKAGGRTDGLTQPHNYAGRVWQTHLVKPSTDTSLIRTKRCNAILMSSLAFTVPKLKEMIDLSHH